MAPNIPESRPGGALSQTASPPAPPAPPAAAAEARKRSLALIFGISAGALVVMLVIFALLARQRGAGFGPGGGPGDGPGGGPGGGGGPVGDGGIPGRGNDTYLAGGLTRVPLPEGWTLVTRGDRTDNPSGYSESVAVRHSGSGVTLAAYVLSGTTSAGDAGTTASDRAREWTRDGQSPQIGGPQGVSAGGEIAGAAAVGYSYTRGSPMEGEVLVAVRGDGVTLAVFVDAPGGQLGPSRGVWEPLRNAILAGFAGVS